MLQQTQVARVEEKYRSFLKKFPTMRVLARASTRDVLKEWQGLGYNRRALALKQLAGVVLRIHGGVLPKKAEDLVKLPGIGPASAGAIAAFAYGTPNVFIETNIRRAYIHEWFGSRKKVEDREIIPLIEKTMDKRNPRDWYYALMDYGSMLGKTLGRENPNKKSGQYAKQATFSGSMREIRGKVLRLAVSGVHTTAELKEKLNIPVGKIRNALNALVREGFLRKRGDRYFVAK